MASLAAEKPNIIVVYTDDHGYADLGCQDVLNDLKTPNIDALSRRGVRMTNGYCTAPQCVPSRAGLLTGRYQNRFGLESNPQLADIAVMDRFGQATTIAERLRGAGYATGMAGKWHLGEPSQITDHGFDHVFHKHNNSDGHWNMDLDGNDFEMKLQTGDGYHLDLVTDFACTFIERFAGEPFFFYAAYRAPHVPLDAPQKYLNRFPGDMPERRRKALAMMSCVDDGVGAIIAALREHKVEEKTLIFVMSDNGAPLKMYKLDAPGRGAGWDGSLNDPLNGEKGMLTEGGIRVPFVAVWKGTIPPGGVYVKPVITLDVAATANALAGLPDDPSLDGVNLIPYLTGQNEQEPHKSLYWRWLGQSAVRHGDWKYLRSDDREYLFNLRDDVGETTDVLSQHSKIASDLHTRLKNWTEELSPPGIWAVQSAGMSRGAAAYFDWYIEGGRQASESGTKPMTTAASNLAHSKQNRSGLTDLQLFELRDKNQDNVVTLEEFIGNRTGSSVKNLTRRFRVYDVDNDGHWDRPRP